MAEAEMASLLAQAKEGTQASTMQLLKTFAFVPEDKLTWAPSVSARSAVQIVSHCGMANRIFATILRGEQVAFPDSPEEAAAMIRNAGKDITSREEAVKLLEEATQEVLAALDTVTAERMQTSPQTPVGTLPFPFWLQVPAMHVGGHVSQVNYIQTIWGDYTEHR